MSDCSFRKRASLSWATWRSALPGRGTQVNLLEQIRKDLFPALGEEVDVAAEGIVIVFLRLQQELERCGLGQAVVDIVEGGFLDVHLVLPAGPLTPDRGCRRR